MIRTCIQYILAYEDSEIQIEYMDFRSSLRSKEFDETRLAALKGSPYFYKKTTIRTLVILLGNAYGRLYDAVAPAMDVLSKLSQKDWGYYVEQCLVNDEEVLDKIICGDERTNRWCDLAEHFELGKMEYNNTKIQEFIKFSEEKDINNTKARARFFRNKINS